MDTNQIIAAAAETAIPLTGNDKRKASCKAIGGEKKRKGHDTEDIFNKKFGIVSNTTYKAEADCSISEENPRGAALLEALNDRFGVFSANKNVSIKTGKNLQFVLGRIDEISGATTDEEKLAAISQEALWQKYLRKDFSEKPADWLAYFTSNEGDGFQTWSIFNMKQVIEFILKGCKWRVLETGRMKGDFEDDSKKGVRQYLTYEYRTTHKSHFLGANGGKGKEFIDLLKNNIECYDIMLAN
jgi:hypothetical protein